MHNNTLTQAFKLLKIRLWKSVGHLRLLQFLHSRLSFVVRSFLGLENEYMKKQCK